MLRLKELRKQTGETQEQIAALIKITRAAYTNIENGKREPDYETLSLLADHFGVSVDYLLGREDIKKSPSEEEELVGNDPEMRTINDMFLRLSPEGRRIVGEHLEFLLAKETAKEKE